LDFFFADDARQQKPTRPGMGPLVAIGGIYVPDQDVRKFEKDVDDLCTSHAYPYREEFKWSPGRELWMRDNLIEGNRERFFIDVLSLCLDRGIKAIVMVADTNYRPANRDVTHEMDVAILFLERVNLCLGRLNKEGVIIVDRPSGDRSMEDKFLSKCLETLQAGTTYVKPDRIAINVLSTPSKLVRLLQVADLITSCSLSFVAGEDKFSPPVFNLIKKMLFSDGGRKGGVGLKIHPDFKYANLYHWLLEDDFFWKANCGIPLPLKGRCFFSNPREP